MSNTIKLRRKLTRLERQEEISLTGKTGGLLEKILVEAQCLFEIKGCGAKVLIAYYSGLDEAHQILLNKFDEYTKTQVKNAYKDLTTLKKMLKESKGNHLYGLWHTVHDNEELKKVGN